MSKIFQLPLFESYAPKVLLIVDVQKPFKEFFPCEYLKKLKWYAGQFETVYQIWDETEAEAPSYQFHNEVQTIVKQYGGDVDESDMENMTDESAVIFKQEEYDYNTKFDLKDGGAIYYIGNGGEGPGHEWFRVSKEYIEFLNELKRLNAEIILVGGGKFECIYDVEISLLDADITFNYNDQLVYNANSGCDQNQDEEIIQD